jgi:hypothetical protein
MASVHGRSFETMPRRSEMLTQVVAMQALVPSLQSTLATAPPNR